jgi:hypothetical protein
LKEFSRLEKILYWLILGNENVAITSFKIEKSLFKNTSSESRNSSHVFIAGLARSGTTILMRSIYSSSQFCSLTYRDMPFILAPNIWMKLSTPFANKMNAIERIHKDGILETYDSPEALEEVFWRIINGNNYINKNSLTLMSANSEISENYIAYVDLIKKKYSRNRYLSKNNNNVLRLQLIKSTFPKSTVIIPFRDPLQHSFSLLKQHIYFSRLHKENRFALNYMNWLGHFEFGMNHLPFVFPNNIDFRFNKESIEYWLELWINTYSYLLENFSSENNIAFISYEILCSETKSVWDKLSEKINISSTPTPEFKYKKHNIDFEIPDYLKEQANNLYERLSAKTMV